MLTIKYQIEFFSDWHLSSGLSVAGDVDSAVLRDTTGLPYIPGKTLKGLLRHAADTILAFQHHEALEKFVESAFGLKTAPTIAPEEADQEKPGQCFFSDAYLPKDLQKNLKANAAALPFLYRKIASTAIQKNGIAEANSLRKIEVTIPMILEATIEEVQKDWKTHFETLFSMVKRMGSGRHRGFGRCAFTYQEIIPTNSL